MCINFVGIGYCWYYCSFIVNMSEEEISTSERFIDEKYIEVTCNNLFTKFKTHLIADMDKKLDEYIFRDKTKESFNYDLLNQPEERLIKCLEKQIEFFKNEIQSKDKIIELLITERQNFAKTETQQTYKKNCDFEFPKRTIKKKKDNINFDNGFINTNMFEKLPHENWIYDSDNNDNDDNSINCKLNEKNITKRKQNGEKKANKNYKDEQKLNKKKRKVISIIGDSIIKNVQGHSLTTNDHMVVVKSFSGATINCMKDHFKPSIRRNPDVLIIHCGTNDLKSETPANQIANNIIELAKSASKMSENTSVIVSSIVHRNDKFNSKVSEVNTELKNLCSECNLGFISNDNINATTHTNRSRLHLNAHGTKLLSENFKFHITC